MAAPWRVVGASVRGVSHVRSGHPCQDAHAWRQVGNLVVAAVADGAGSAPLAEVGSRIAVDAAIAAVVAELEKMLPADDAGWQALHTQALSAARDAVEREATASQRQPAEYATTLLLAVVGDDLLSACQVGDGAIVARLSDDSLLAVTRPQPGEYLNETTFLTSDDYQTAVQFAMQRQPIGGLVLLSDGLQMLALQMPQGTPHAGFFSPLLQFAAVADPARASDLLRDFLQSDRISQRAEDDLTLVIAVP